jgi:hypothetical protein
MKQFTIRASKMPAFFQCPQSVMNTDGIIEAGSDKTRANEGTLIHELAAKHLRGEVVPDIENYFHLFPPEDQARLAALYSTLLEYLPELQKAMDDPQVETEIKARFSLQNIELELTGHADVIQYRDDSAWLVDFKTGAGRDNDQQMNAYAAILFGAAGQPEKYKVVTVLLYLDTGETVRTVHTPDSIRLWLAQVYERLSRIQYSPGAGCMYCPLFHGCKVGNGYAAAALAAVLGQPELSKIPEGPERAAAYVKMKLAKRVTDNADQLLNMYVKANGPWDLGDGTQLVQKKVSKRIVDGRKGWAVFEEMIGLKALLKYVSIDFHAILRNVYERAPIGSKQRLKAELETSLQQKGAVRSYFQTAVQRVKKA